MSWEFMVIWSDKSLSYIFSAMALSTFGKVKATIDNFVSVCVCVSLSCEYCTNEGKTRRHFQPMRALWWKQVTIDGLKNLAILSSLSTLDSMIVKLITTKISQACM